MNPAVKTRSRLVKLGQILKGKSRLLIVMQDNPDPDSIAAAVALRKIANTFDNIQCTITHGGTVGRAENRALVRYLGLNLHPLAEIEFGKFDCIAIVDAQPAAGNCSLPANVTLDIVIDHHPMRAATRSVQFIDIRSKYGSTSTILLEYLVQGRIEPDIQLATALFYGIRSDTQDLGRQATRQDSDAIAYLFPIANKRMLSEIERGEVPRAYFQMLDEALRNARKHEHAIITDLGQIDNPDMIAEVADLLLREEETYWTMCHGISGGKLFISVRTMKEDARADKVVRRVVAGKGTGGGHPAYAGGQISLLNVSKSRYESLKKLIQRRFLRAIGSDAQHWQKLIPG